MMKSWLLMLQCMLLVVTMATASGCGSRVGGVRFYVQRGRTLGRSSYTVGSARNIPDAYLRGTKIHLLIHGWKGRSNLMERLGYQLYRGNKGPVIQVDWSRWSGNANILTYTPACARTTNVGAEVAAFIRALESRGYHLSNMHLIGWSLGGKVSAAAGACLRGQVGRITGLDTPLYCSTDKRLTGPRLDTSDAQFVDTIRTTVLSGAHFQEQGHADFFVGCEVSRTNCFCPQRLAPLTIGERHSDAVNIFKNSINDRNCQIRFNKACDCPRARCTSSLNTMGYPATKPSENRKYITFMAGSWLHCKQ